MNSFVLTCVPLFMLMAEILRVSGLSSRIYAGLAKLVAPASRRIAADQHRGLRDLCLGQWIEHRDRGVDRGRRPAAAHCAQIRPAIGGGVARGRRHTRHPAAPELRNDRLRHLHRNLGPEIVHGRRCARPDHDGGLHDLYRRPRPNWPAVAPREAGARNRCTNYCVALADVLPFGILIAGTLGGIYAGLVTTTEGATIGCILAIILGATFGNLTLRGAIDAMYSTIKFSGNILFIIFTAYVFSYAISFAGVGEKVTAFIVGLQPEPARVFLALFILYHGARLPDRKPRHDRDNGAADLSGIASYGIDPMLFGVVLVLFVELGQISPPIGINLFVIQSIWDGKLSEVILGTVPFHLAMFVVLALVILMPDLALWLPHQMSR